MVDAITNLPQLIGEKVESLMKSLFMPDEEAMNEKINSIKERFGFISDITGLGEEITGFLENASGITAPTFTIDLSKYTGSYGWGNTMITIDFSWYAQFKPMVDTILAGMIWITFLWHLYKRIPEIIAGQGMVTADSIKIHDNLSNRGDD